MKKFIEKHELFILTLLTLGLIAIVGLSAIQRMFNF